MEQQTISTMPVDAGGASPPGATPLVLTAVAATSAGAAVVHFAMLPAHYQESIPLGLAFAAAAWCQLALAVAVVLRPTRRAFFVGILGSLVITAAWIVSRTGGLPLPGAAGEVEAVGTIDLICVGFQVVTMAACGIALRRRSQPRSRSRVMPFAVVALPAVAVLAITTAALASPAGTHEHDHADAVAGSDHAAGDHDMTDAATGDHDMGEHDAAPAADSPSTTDDHSHDAPATGDTPAAAGTTHDHAMAPMPARLDHDPTDEQIVAARQLIASTATDTAKYADLAVARAAGYVSIGDGRTGAEHYVNAAYMANATILDPTQPESLVYQVQPDGSRRFTTVMYILPPGSTMDDVPDVAGNLTMWHAHDTLCFDGVKISGVLVNGSCRPSGTPGTPPMLHVWVTPNDCGPFAGTDAKQMTGSCTDDPRLRVS